jgi:NAD(P)-dependent dehydrogenase (short-subunit alcohol dehydrogenase family)
MNDAVALSGKSAIVTGGSQGLGFEIARYFLQAGANVLLCARDGILLQKAAHTLSVSLAAGAKVIACPCDIAESGSVRAMVAEAFREFGKLDVLVCNAGVHGAIGPVESVDWTAWQQAVEVNLTGSVQVVRSVLPAMKQQKNGKIIFVSGGGATKPMPGMSAYAASKAALVRFAETLAEEVRPFGIDVNSIAPGAMNTRLLDEVLAAGPEKVGKKYYQTLQRQVETGGTPPQRAAELCVFLASAASDGITGKLISALWDPWQKLPDYLNEIEDSDIYTLRRILPSDRGKSWGDAT